MVSEIFKNKLKKHLIKFTVEDTFYGYCKNSQYVYFNLFNPPINRIFYWNEEDFQGMIYSVYEYENTFIFLSGSFGSCSGCDYWEGTRTLDELNAKLDKIFNNLTFYNSLSEISKTEFTKYTHPDAILAFTNFENNYSK